MRVLAYSPEIDHQHEVVEINRRTDDILFDVKYLADNILDREAEIFNPEAEDDVLEQDFTEIAEADVHSLATIVHQRRDRELGQYVSLGSGTVDHARKGRDSLGLTDHNTWFEYNRRDVELVDEQNKLEPEQQEGMKAGGKTIIICPRPTDSEASAEVADSFGYDDRTMVRLQGLTPDTETKIMMSFSIFGVPAEAWAAYLSDINEREVDPSALSVMKVSSDLPLEYGSFYEVLARILQGVRNYIPEEDRENLDSQLEAFLQDQAELTERVDFYARERLAFQKELALSLGGPARPAIVEQLMSVRHMLKDEAQIELAKRTINGQLRVDDYVAELAIKINTLMTDNRAGLATHNERTIRRVAEAIGLEATLDMAVREQYIIDGVEQGLDVSFMVIATERSLAEAGVSCGGGCAVEVVDLFSAEALEARKAGLKGTLWESDSLNEGSKCSCAKKNRKAKVISDGKNAVCTTCGDYQQASGKTGNIKKAAKN